MKTNKIAVVILNYNGEKLLPVFLPSVIHHSPKADIYVADNCSTDQSLPLLRSNFPEVSVIPLEKNFGFCEGYNQALRHVQSEFYVLLNSDVEVTEGWLDPIVSLFERDMHIAAVQPKILSYMDKNKFEYAGAAGGLIDSLGYPFCRGRVLKKIEEDCGQYNDEVEIFWASGACMGVRASVFDELGGFDEDYFAHMEEIDLCWKMHRANYRVFYTGQSKVFHLGAGTLSYESPYKTYLNFRNNLSTLIKHVNFLSLLWKFPLRICLDWIASLVFFGQGSLRNGLAVWKAHFYLVTHLSLVLKKRSELKLKWGFYSGPLIIGGVILLNKLREFKNPR